MYNTTLAGVNFVKPDALKSVTIQLSNHMPKGKVILPLTHP